MTLTELSKQYHTDKADHGYLPLYEKHLPQSVGKLLEIGVWKGEGIKMFREYYGGKGIFYGMDLFTEGYGLITPEQLQACGINHFKGSQDDVEFLSGISEQFTVIIDDGSHHTISQITSFKRLFVHNLEPGGLYVVEDTHDYNNPYWRQDRVERKEDTLLGAVMDLVSGGTLASKLISKKEAAEIEPLIRSIHHYNNEIIFFEKC